jgi:hypothetical protein
VGWCGGLACNYTETLISELLPDVISADGDVVLRYQSDRGPKTITISRHYLRAVSGE